MKLEIFKSLPEIKEKLSYFGVTKDELRDVALAAASAKHRPTALHPINAPGTYSYMEGVASTRNLFLSKKGWRIDRPNNLEAVTNDALAVSIIFQNVHEACGNNTPQAISDKGDGARKLVNKSGYLFEFMEKEERLKENHNVWFFCVSIDGEDVRAELSRPMTIESGQFGEFSERIFVVTDSSLNISNEGSDSDESSDQYEEPEISITKKV